MNSPWNSPGQNARVGSLSFLQGIFPTQGLNPGLPHYRRILYQLSHKGSPRILEWVAYPFSRGSSQPRNQTGSPALQVYSLPAELPGKPYITVIYKFDFHKFEFFRMVPMSNILSHWYHKQPHLCQNLGPDFELIQKFYLENK